MRLTEKLLGYLHRVFAVAPDASSVLRFHGVAGLYWEVSDGVMAVSAPGHPMQSADLSEHTVGSLVVWLAGLPGMQIDWSDVPAYGLSALGVLDASGHGDGDLRSFAAPLYAYMHALAVELHLSRRQIDEMLLQTTIPTASQVWLDEWGGYFGIPRAISEPDVDYRRRIVAEVMRPLINNTAIETAMSVAMGQPVQVEDVFEWITLGLTYDGSRTYDGTWTFNAASSELRYGLFDAVIGYDLLGGWSPGEYVAVVREIAERMRAAGTFLRGLSLAAGRIEDVVPVEFCDTLSIAMIRGSNYDGTWSFDGARTFSGGVGDVETYHCDGSVDYATLGVAPIPLLLDGTWDLSGVYRLTGIKSPIA